MNRDNKGTTNRLRSYVLSEAMINALEARARDQGCSQSYLVRKAISQLLGIKDEVVNGKGTK